MHNVKSEHLLKQTKAVLILNLFDYIRDLIEKYEYAFKEPEVGIYLTDYSEPILKNNQVYYSESSYKTQTPINSLDDINEPILDQNGEIVIPLYIMRRKDKMLSSKPTLPVKALQIAYAIVDDTIDEMLPYTPAREYNKNVLEHVLPEHHNLVIDGYFESALNRLINEVLMFIGGDNWNMYYLKLNRCDLIIEKSCDYRIFDWTFQKEREALIVTDE